MAIWQYTGFALNLPIKNAINITTNVARFTVKTVYLQFKNKIKIVKLKWRSCP